MKGFLTYPSVTSLVNIKEKKWHLANTEVPPTYTFIKIVSFLVVVLFLMNKNEVLVSSTFIHTLAGLIL
jgi:hypothetical protein